MAWRFKASKYKNAAPIVPKPEACIRDICVGSYQTFGNNICASAAFMAFNWEHVGSSMAVLPLDDCGRKSKTMPLLHAHSDTITDMDFSPFHDGLLMTGSQDSLVKIWHIPEEGLKESLSTPECSLSQKQRRVENVGFHPVADGLIHVASGHQVSLWDLTCQVESFVNQDHSEVIQSTSWKKDGRLLATSCKDKKVRIIDPRVNESVLSVANSHQNIKDSRIVWLGNQDRVLTTGFDSARLRQIMIRDVRNLSQVQKSLELDCSTGVLMPLFDADTNMLFLAGKGDTTILYMELTDREPYLIEGLRHTGEQTKGACLVPKRAMRVMEGEVNRVLQLTGSTVVPIMYQVPRKSYREYHSDLYPDTSGQVTYLSAPMWLKNIDHAVPNISLHPDSNNCVQIHRGNLETVVKAILSMPCPTAKKPVEIIKTVQKSSPNPEKDETPPPIDSDETDRINFVNVKDLIKGMEKKDTKIESAKENGLKNGHLIIDNHNTEDMKKEELYKDENKDSDEKELVIPNTKYDEEKDSAGDEVSIEKTNGNVQAPKPLPRSSRSESSVDEPEVPKPKPRTAVSGYKPRLGPKPFSISQNNDEFSFEKVFSVPAVPGKQKNDSAISPVNKPVSPISAVPKELTEDKEKSLSPCSDSEPPKEEYTNGKSDTSIEEEVNSSDSGYKPKTPTTAERRKIFETTDVQSIAERRKAYEMRSVSAIAEPETMSPTPLRRRDSLKSRKSPEREDKRASVPIITTKRTTTVFGRVSKFRHLKGTHGHKSTHIENIKNVNRQVSGESNGFYANGSWACVSLTGGGGRVGVWLIPKGNSHSLLRARPLTDWAIDPFQHMLATAHDDGSVAFWKLHNDLPESTNEPDRTFAAHNDKIYIVKYHPTASDILTTAAQDFTIKIWDLSAEQPKAEIVLEGHGDQIFAFEWSTNGDMLATVCKDGFVRIFKPRSSCEAISKGVGPSGGRGARVVWALNDTHLVITGFDKVSERQILLYKASDLSAPICTVGLDVSPSILQIHLDQDSNTLFLTGRGDSTIYCYEVTCESPYLCPLSHHRCSNLHQGIAFLPKNVLQVEKVEFAKAMRLTNGVIEPLSFTVPRIKTEFFQDDLFPPTLVTWHAWQSGDEWFKSKYVKPLTVSLQPEGMLPLSSQTVPAKEKEPKDKQSEKAKPDLIRSHVPFDTNKDKQDSILKSMSAKVQMNLKLEQDNMEGVDESEWD